MITFDEVNLSIIKAPLTLILVPVPFSAYLVNSSAFKDFDSQALTLIAFEESYIPNVADILEVLVILELPSKIVPTTSTLHKGALNKSSRLS